MRYYESLITFFHILIFSILKKAPSVFWLSLSADILSK